MKTIYKYPFKINGYFNIEMPENSPILCVQIDESTGNPAIWAMVDTENKIVGRNFEIHGTGNDMGETDKITRNYIGTVQTTTEWANLVLHIFERIK